MGANRLIFDCKDCAIYLICDEGSKPEGKPAISTDMRRWEGSAQDQIISRDTL
jgi:hypothetical protein